MSRSDLVSLSVQLSWAQGAALAQRAAIAGARAMFNEIASGRCVTAERKDDFTFVLNLDLLSDKAIRDCITDKHKIVSEEEPTSHALLGSLDPYFLVDPLDGTNNCRRALSFFGPQLNPMQESFGPLVGYVEDGVICAASFVSLTESLVWSAIRGHGCTVTALTDAPGEPLDTASRTVMMAVAAPRLRECGVVFYPGKRGELELLLSLRSNELVDGCYRYGGFAGDCTRLVRAREQILIQFSIKPWDLVAGLLAMEAGCVAIAYSPDAILTNKEANNVRAKLVNKLQAYPLERIVFANNGCAQELMTVINSL